VVHTDCRFRNAQDWSSLNQAFPSQPATGGDTDGDSDDEDDASSEDQESSGKKGETADCPPSIPSHSKSNDRGDDGIKEEPHHCGPNGTHSVPYRPQNNDDESDGGDSDDTKGRDGSAAKRSQPRAPDDDNGGEVGNSHPKIHLEDPQHQGEQSAEDHRELVGNSSHRSILGPLASAIGRTVRYEPQVAPDPSLGLSEPAPLCKRSLRDSQLLSPKSHAGESGGAMDTFPGRLDMISHGQRGSFGDDFGKTPIGDWLLPRLPNQGSVGDCAGNKQRRRDAGPLVVAASGAPHSDEVAAVLGNRKQPSQEPHQVFSGPPNGPPTPPVESPPIPARDLVEGMAAQQLAPAPAKVASLLPESLPTDGLGQVDVASICGDIWDIRDKSNKNNLVEDAKELFLSLVSAMHGNNGVTQFKFQQNTVLSPDQQDIASSIEKLLCRRADHSSINKTSSPHGILVTTLRFILTTRMTTYCIHHQDATKIVDGMCMYFTLPPRCSNFSVVQPKEAYLLSVIHTTSLLAGEKRTW
jgi:hypothetical protein